MATLVQSNSVWKLSRQGSHLQNIRQKFTNLINRIPDFLGWMMLLQMQNARSRWTHDVIKSFKIIAKIRITTRGRSGKTRIGHRLAATSLVFGNEHFAAKFLQQFQTRHRNLRVELVNVTWNKQGNTHPNIVVIQLNSWGFPPHKPSMQHPKHWLELLLRHKRQAKERHVPTSACTIHFY